LKCEPLAAAVGICRFISSSTIDDEEE